MRAAKRERTSAAGARSRAIAPFARAARAKRMACGASWSAKPHLHLPRTIESETRGNRARLLDPGYAEGLSFLHAATELTGGCGGSLDRHRLRQLGHELGAQQPGQGLWPRRQPRRRLQRRRLDGRRGELHGIHRQHGWSDAGHRGSGCSQFGRRRGDGRQRRPRRWRLRHRRHGFGRGVGCLVGRGVGCRIGGHRQRRHHRRGRHHG